MCSQHILADFPSLVMWSEHCCLKAGGRGGRACIPPSGTDLQCEILRQQSFLLWNPSKSKIRRKTKDADWCSPSNLLLPLQTFHPPTEPYSRATLLPPTVDQRFCHRRCAGGESLRVFRCTGGIWNVSHRWKCARRSLHSSVCVTRAQATKQSGGWNDAPTLVLDTVHY